MRCDIAIVGMAALFPDARDVHDYWQNVLSKRDSLTEVPESYWRRDEFYDPDPRAADKTYGFKAGLVDSVAFDSLEYGIPPKVMEAIAVDQLFALVAAKQALEDARLIGVDARPFDRARAGVILGASLGKTAFSLSHRLQAPRVRRMMLNAGIAAPVADRVIARIKDVELEWSEACNPGYLANVVAGRIANRFDLRGTNGTADAACASSLAALKFAVHELESGDCDAMLTGGVNLDCSDFSFVSFSKTPAISRSNRSRPFDAESDGMMLGDGIGMLVLKRRAEAERSGDTIYAVIRGIGSSGDGRARSIFAPRAEGQQLALERAYGSSGIDPASVRLVEAHGTGTRAGDECEAQALAAFFGHRQIPPQSIALGSVKSQIGHSRLTAGAAGMIKAALALHHKVLPATINVSRPNPVVDWERSPFHVIDEPRPWVVNDQAPVRRAAVSSFGFGGTNFHIVLEEHGRDHSAPYRMHEIPQDVVLSAPSVAALGAECSTWARRLAEDAGSAWAALSSQAANPATADRRIPGDWPRLGLVAVDVAQTRALLELAAQRLAEPASAAWDHPRGLFFREREVDHAGRVVALFPGQGSQYPDMLREVAQNHPELRELLSRADDVLLARGQPPISELVYPISFHDPARRTAHDARLQETEHTQPALAAVNGGLYRILRARGFRPDFVAGHSFGELTALWASGAWQDATYLAAAVERGQLMAAAAREGGGTMVAIHAKHDAVLPLIAAVPEVYLANHNHASQLVVSGSHGGIAALAAALERAQLRFTRLAVSAPFHSPLLARAGERFSRWLDDLGFDPPEVPVYLGASGARAPSEPAALRAAFRDQMQRPVLFANTIDALYRDGARIFVEIGPKQVLTSFVGHILGDRDHHAIAINASAAASGELQLCTALVRLRVLGVPLAADRHRRPAPLRTEAQGSATTFELPPTFFFTPEKRARMDRALSERDLAEPAPAAVEPPRDAMAHGATSPRPAGTTERHDMTRFDTHNDTPDPRVGPGSIDGDGSDASFTSALTVVEELQRVNLQALEGFYRNQSLHVELIRRAVDRDAGSLAIGPGIPANDDIAAGLQLSSALQANTFAACQTYFEHQKALLDRLLGAPIEPGARQAPPALAPVARPELPAASRQPAPPPAAPPALPSVQAPRVELQPPIASAAPTPARTTGDADLGRILLGVVSESTGYPVEMLEPSMSLEAELGIDSIKRVEIFSALHERLPGGIGQEDVERLATLATLREIHDYLAGRERQHQGVPALRVAQAAEPHPGPADAIAPAPPAGGPGEIDVAAIFTQVVSESTGYPQDMLEPSMSLEADLGIDSIKRVEIFSALHDRLPQGVQSGDVEALATLTTLRDVIEYLARAARPTVPRAQASKAREIKRYEVVRKDLALPASRTLAVRPGVVLITAEDTGLSVAVARSLADLGVASALVTWPDQGAAASAGWNGPVHAIASIDDAGIEAAWQRIARDHGNVTGVIHVQPLAPERRTMTEVFDPQAMDLLRGVFLLAKQFRLHALRDEPARDGAFLLCVTRVDGQLGLGEVFSGRVVEGGLCGLTKSLRQEWDGAFARTVDLSPALAIGDAAACVLEELLDSDQALAEVGRPAANRRVTLALHERYAEGPAGRAPGRDDVFVIPGGGRGITAQCAIRLAAAFQCRMVLLGRMRFEDDEPAWVAGASTAQDVRQRLLERSRQEGLTVTPKEIDARIAEIVQQREIRRTLEAIRRAGGQAEYRACDVTDREAVAACLADAQRRLGRVTGLIHGAGVLADKKIQRKSEHDYRRVFETKVVGLENLLAQIQPESLRYLILFSSVAAYFGSGGQIDYSMANEVLNKLAHAYHRRHPHAVVCAMNWGPWAGGMVHPTLKAVLEATGVKIIPVETGVDYLLEELTSGTGTSQVVINGRDHMVMPQVDIKSVARASER